MGMIQSEIFFTQLPQLETDRLILRKLSMKDAQDMFNYSQDEEVARHVLWEAYRSIGDAKAYIRYSLRRARLGEPNSWGIYHKADQKLVGTIGFMWWNTEHDSAEVGYSLARAYWNQGLMTEALAEVIKYSFTVLDIHRIEAQHESANPASGAVMRKVGMLWEGTLRGRLRNKGRYVDVELYSILRSDFLKNHLMD